MEQEQKTSQPEAEKIYKIQFRKKEQVFSATSRIDNLQTGDVVMIQTDHNLEPATVLGFAAQPGEGAEHVKISHSLQRRGSRDEVAKYARLLDREAEAFTFCHNLIGTHKLSMKLIKVERFFNGSKIIFYFTAENRVDFRQLVKDLVQEFRTRVEMRQIGVRHETKMVGGLGCCGRELCCSSYIKNFAPVSIKMAKEQSLPLNPVKISGICNRLLCCLTYEYPVYQQLKKDLPRYGKKLTVDGKTYKVIKLNILEESVTVIDMDDPSQRSIITKKEWLEKSAKGGGRAQKPGGKKTDGKKSERPRKKSSHKSHSSQKPHKKERSSRGRRKQK